MLAVDLSEISDVEGVFVAGLAELVVDGLHTLVEGITNQLLWADGDIFDWWVKKGFPTMGLLH